MKVAEKGMNNSDQEFSEFLSSGTWLFVHLAHLHAVAVVYILQKYVPNKDVMRDTKLSVIAPPVLVRTLIFFLFLIE